MPVSFVDPGVSKEDITTTSTPPKKRKTIKKQPPSSTPQDKITTSHPRSNPEAVLFEELIDTIRHDIKAAEQTAKEQKVDNNEGVRSLTRKAIRKGLVGHRWL